MSDSNNETLSCMGNYELYHGRVIIKVRLLIFTWIYGIVVVCDKLSYQ